MSLYGTRLGKLQELALRSEAGARATGLSRDTGVAPGPIGGQMQGARNQFLDNAQSARMEALQARSLLNKDALASRRLDMEGQQFDAEQFNKDLDRRLKERELGTNHTLALARLAQDQGRFDTTTGISLRQLANTESKDAWDRTFKTRELEENKLVKLANDKRESEWKEQLERDKAGLNRDKFGLDKEKVSNQVDQFGQRIGLDKEKAANQRAKNIADAKIGWAMKVAQDSLSEDVAKTPEPDWEKVFPDTNVPVVAPVAASAASTPAGGSKLTELAEKQKQESQFGPSGIFLNTIGPASFVGEHTTPMVLYNLGKKFYDMVSGTPAHADEAPAGNYNLNALTDLAQSQGAPNPLVPAETQTAPPAPLMESEEAAFAARQKAWTDQMKAIFGRMRQDESPVSIPRGATASQNNQGETVWNIPDTKPTPIPGTPQGRVAGLQHLQELIGRATRQRLTYADQAAQEERIPMLAEQMKRIKAQQYLEWAQRTPNDPRAQLILQQMGVVN